MRNVEVSGLDDSDKEAILDVGKALAKVGADRLEMAMKDAGSETVENLEAAAAIHGRAVRAKRLQEIKNWHEGSTLGYGKLIIDGEDLVSVISELIYMVDAAVIEGNV